MGLVVLMLKSLILDLAGYQIQLILGERWLF